MANNRRGGIIEVRTNGTLQDAKGSFTYNLGHPKKNGIVGSDSVHGYSETPQIAYIAGKITDRQSLDLKALVTLEDTTVTLRLANGKTVVLHEAWYAGDGVGDSAEGEIDVRFESRAKGEET